MAKIAATSSQSFFPRIWVGMILSFYFSTLSFANSYVEEPQQTTKQALEDAITSELDSYFKKFNLSQPIKVETNAQIILSQDPSPILLETHLSVKVLTDQPPVVIREARQRILRLLREKGYRLEKKDPDQLPDADDGKPLATLTMEAVLPAVSDVNEKNNWIYAGFAIIVLALITSLGFLLYVLVLPLVRWRQKVRGRLSSEIKASDRQRREPDLNDLPPFPSSTISYQTPMGPSILTPSTLPPLPRHSHLSTEGSHGSKSKSEEIPSVQESKLPLKAIDLGSWSTLQESK